MSPTAANSGNNGGSNPTDFKSLLIFGIGYGLATTIAVKAIERFTLGGRKEEGNKIANTNQKNENDQRTENSPSNPSVCNSALPPVVIIMPPCYSTNVEDFSSDIVASATLSSAEVASLQQSSTSSTKQETTVVFDPSSRVVVASEGLPSDSSDVASLQQLSTTSTTTTSSNEKAPQNEATASSSVGNAVIISLAEKLSSVVTRWDVMKETAEKSLKETVGVVKKSVATYNAARLRKKSVPPYCQYIEKFYKECEKLGHKDCTAYHDIMKRCQRSGETSGDGSTVTHPPLDPALLL